MKIHHAFRAKPTFICSFLCAAAALFCGGVVFAQTPSPASTPWAWPSIPSCLADPGTSTQGAADYNAPVCALYNDLLAGAGSEVELVSARRVNAELDGVLYPAFLPGTEVVRFFVAGKFNDDARGPHRLVRVSLSRNGARFGSWWTTFEQVSSGGQLLSADAIRSVLALTYAPACIAYEDSVHAGVRAYLSVAAPAFDRRGGGVEWWFPPNAVVATTVGAIPGGAGCP